MSFIYDQVPEHARKVHTTDSQRKSNSQDACKKKPGAALYHKGLQMIQNKKTKIEAMRE